MDKYRLGILSLYYNNANYGGQLQAYALCKKVNELIGDKGEAEQICYEKTYFDRTKIPKPTYKQKLAMFFNAPILEKTGYLRLFYQRIINKLRGKFASTKTKVTEVNSTIDPLAYARDNVILRFSQSEIMHSDKIYNHFNAAEMNEYYDGFIVGSDQVWNPEFYNPGLFLDFAANDKYKASYAASISQQRLDAKFSFRFKSHLIGFDKISLRESNTEILDGIAQIPVEVSLDPTLLLTKEEWDIICSKRIVDEPYLFCYFLGDSIEQRKRAEEYAKINKLKIVTFPNLLGKYRECDADFGDFRLYDSSPQDFISLIKYSDYIFTDSFHASVFSLIYHKQFLVFQRAEFPAMITRINTLLDLFEVKERILDENCGIDEMQNLANVDYSNPFNKFNCMKEKSIKYLNSVIDDAITKKEELSRGL